MKSAESEIGAIQLSSCFGNTKQQVLTHLNVPQKGVDKKGVGHSLSCSVTGNLFLFFGHFLVTFCSNFLTFLPIPFCLPLLRHGDHVLCARKEQRVFRVSRPYLGKSWQCIADSNRGWARARVRTGRGWARAKRGPSEAGRAV